MTSNQKTHNVSQCETFSFNPNVVPALYFLMFPLALLLNGVAAWVSLHLKSTSNFVMYLKNLVAADIIMTLIMPIKAARDLGDVSKTLYTLSCLVSVVFYSTLYTCIAFLGCISLDRFFKIMTPHSKFSQNLILSKVLSGTVWVTIFGCTALPNIIVSKFETNMTEITTCMILKKPVGLVIHEMIVIYENVFFWIVSVVIAVCYISIAHKVIQSFRNSGSSNNHGQKKIKLRVFLVVIVFFVSFGPYHIVRIPYTFQQVNYTSFTACDFLSVRIMKEISLWLASTNICVVPILYVFLCREFKEKLVSMMKNASISFKASAGKAKGTTSQRS